MAWEKLVSSTKRIVEPKAKGKYKTKKEEEKDTSFK
jgi:hypothetical protein